MRMAVPNAVLGVIVGEVTSSTKGLGLFIHEAHSPYDPAGVFAGIVILLAFVVVANVLAGRLERRFLRWETTAPHPPGDILNPSPIKRASQELIKDPTPALTPPPGMAVVPTPATSPETV